MWLTGRSTVIQLRWSERKLGREKICCFSLLSCQILKLRSSLCTIHLSQFGLYFTKVDYFLIPNHYLSPLFSLCYCTLYLPINLSHPPSLSIYLPTFMSGFSCCRGGGGCCFGLFQLFPILPAAALHTAKPEGKYSTTVREILEGSV